jgi:hypothetical protein
MPNTIEQKQPLPDAAQGKPTYLRLTLSDFTIMDRFRGFYEYGERYLESKPEYRAIINAKWKYDSGSEKLLLHGNEIKPQIVQFLPTTNRIDTERSCADDQFLVIYMMEDVFWQLVNVIRRGDIERAILILRAEPHRKLADRLSLIFGNIDITHKELAEKNTLSKVGKRFEHILYGIGCLLLLILLALWHK